MMLWSSYQGYSFELRVARRMSSSPMPVKMMSTSVHPAFAVRRKKAEAVLCVYRPALRATLRTHQSAFDNSTAFDAGCELEYTRV